MSLSSLKVQCKERKNETAYKLRIMMAIQTRFLRKIALILFSGFLVAGALDWFLAVRWFNSKPAARLQFGQSGIAQFLEMKYATLRNPATSSPNFAKEVTTKKKSQKHKTSLITTRKCEQHYFLVILICSAPANAERRRDIRHTWGLDSALKPRWKTVFLVAQTHNPSESDSLLKEDEAFGDLIRASFLDHYWKLTPKIQVGYEWATRYCKFSFLLKIDDDVFVETRGLISLLNDTGTSQRKLYMGRLYRKPPVIRSGKWRVTLEEYNRTNYPDFCPGFGYALSADVVHLFVELFDVVPTFRMDDVYVGMLADRADVKVVNNDGFIVGPPRVTDCVLQNDTLVWHGIFGECLFQVYNQNLEQKSLIT